MLRRASAYSLVSGLFICFEGLKCLHALHSYHSEMKVDLVPSDYVVHPNFTLYIVHCKNKYIIWLLQSYDIPSCANSKNVVLVKYFVEGSYQLQLHEFSISTIAFMKFA